VRQPGCPDRSDPMAAPSGGNLSVGRPRRRPFSSVWWTLWRATTTTRARARAGGDDEERREETCLGKGEWVGQMAYSCLLARLGKGQVLVHLYGRRRREAESEYATVLITSMFSRYVFRQAKLLCRVHKHVVLVAGKLLRLHRRIMNCVPLLYVIWVKFFFPRSNGMSIIPQKITAIYII
jgi:hypothetical protein